MLIDLFYAMKDEYRLWREGPPAPPVQRPSPPPPAPPLESPPLNDLPAVKNWSHPFGDTSSVFQQLATLAKAQSGYFPLGRNGLWHGGVHFDSGTAGTAGPQGQSFVRCLADGEVIAYRIPEQTPKTTFFPAPGVIMKAPFATGFVLVCHRLEAPKIEGVADTPPSLIFYSLYMHLADWASYLADPDKPRPAFWPESNQYRVKTDTDFSPVRAGERGLNLRHAPTQGKTIGFLPQGTAITVSGEGAYRKVEGIKGPVKLQNPDGTLQGYVGFSALLDLGGGAYRVNTTRDALRVRPTPDTSRDKIFELPSGTEITISGEGDFRKLESVVQYVHLASLEGERVPERGKVVVLDRPRPIKAGDLIGHLGPYQESNEEAPQERLHLEVFACENVEAFFARSRQWADQMPEKARTWLKLEKGTTVVVHQPGHSHSAPPNLGDPHVASGAKLLIPRTELDGLSADRKITVPATETSKARNWYRLDDLLIDAAGKDIPMGWICDEIGVTPWVNPWSWDGYEVIYNDDPPQNALAHFLLNMGDYFDGKEMEQWKPLADASDKGPVRERLFEIIDADRDGKITTDEIQKALKVPAYAQSISQLVIHYESEWFYQQRKWDALDKVLGHTGSTPILNWVAEKERIKELSWWEEVSVLGYLPNDAVLSFLNPIGILIGLSGAIGADDVSWLIVPRGQLTFDVEGNDVENERNYLHKYFSRIAHWPGGESGVTIGRGYDLGQRPFPEMDLGGVGIQEPLFSWLLGAKGLRGESAKAYLERAPENIKKQAITREQQYKLFLLVYDFMRKEVIRISGSSFNVNNYGILNWEAVDSKIQDVVVDLIYRGDYTPEKRAVMQRYFVDSDILGMRKVMSGIENWYGVPSDRYMRRREYLN
ncbi:hypothetical protein PSm6_46360 [Pseudomonas solani]|uniref:EF-hand domain-containing protein n=1 Tax=Pseudomonas solani TaxID=2731552 RepID=A0ABN6BWN9_9PSED|nr:hypothetical protein [Pseudomonas solani]BCD88229.1 hypothetical protein PSm6_46360 [Pseudomonas solani]